MPSLADIFVRYAEPDIDDREGTPFDGLTGDRTYTSTFLVESRIKAITEVMVCSCPGCPLPWSPHPSDLAALCVKLRAKRRVKGEWRFWTVTATYSTIMPVGGPQIGKQGSGDTADNPRGAGNNPETEYPEIEWDFENSSRAPDEDLDGKAFLNSAGQPYMPARTFEYANAVLMISRNELDFNRVLASKYAYSVNKDQFLGARPGSVLCLPPKAKLVWKGSIRYWRVSYRLKFGERLLSGALRLWDPVEILDAGMMQIKPVPGQTNKFQLVPIVVNGFAVSQPVCLDGKGRQLLPVRVPGVGGAPDTFTMEAVYNKYRIRRRTNFKALLRSGLGGTL